MSKLRIILHEIYVHLVRGVTGRLFTEEQIKELSNNSLVQYFSDIFPDINEQKNRKQKLQEAQIHISAASLIVDEIRNELISQSAELDRLIDEIEAKKGDARKYAELAKTNKEAALAVSQEIEESIKEGLRTQSRQGRNLRRIASIIIWGLTMLIGAALGAYFKEIVAFISG